MMELDLGPRFYSVILVSLVSLVLLIRFPAGNAFLGFTILGLGGQTIMASVTFAMTVPCMQLLTAVRLMAKPAKNGRGLELGRTAGISACLLLAALLLVWLKIAAESCFGGMDAYRKMSLRVSLYTVWLPAVILLLSLRRQGMEQTAVQLFCGLCALPLVYLIPVLPNVFQDGRLLASMEGEQRLRFYGMDSINSSLMMFFGASGFMIISIMSLQKQLLLRIFFVAVSSGLSALLLLGGTRQFLAAFILLAGFVLVIGKVIKDYRNVLVVMLFVAGIYTAREVFIKSIMWERLSSDSLTVEWEHGRGQIWKEVVTSAMENPIQGAGFRRFGSEYESYDPVSRDTTIQRDTAHGITADVLAEHGVVLAILLISGLLLACRQSISLIIDNNENQKKRMVILFLLILCIPENISTTACNAFGHSMLAVTMAYLAWEPRRNASRRAKGKGRLAVAPALPLGRKLMSPP